MHFRYFDTISPCKRTWSFNLIDLNPLYPRMRCDKSGRNRPSDSGEEENNLKRLQIDREPDNKRSEKLTFFGSGEIKRLR